VPRVEVGVQSVSNPDNFKGLGLGNAAIALVDFLEKDIIEPCARYFRKRFQKSEVKSIAQADLDESNELVHSGEHD
jgi:hypothetical protein